MAINSRCWVASRTRDGGVGGRRVHRAAALHGAAALHRAVLASAQLTDARGTWIRLTHVRGFVNVWLYHLFLIHIFVCSSSSHASPIVIVSLRRGRAAFGRSACCQPCGTLRCPVRRRVARVASRSVPRRVERVTVQYAHVGSVA